MFKQPRDAKGQDVTKGKRILFFLRDVLQSLYPDSYQRFVQKRIGQGMVYFTGVVLLSALIFLLLFAVNFTRFSTALGSELDKFEALEFNASMELEEPVILGQDKVVIAENMNYTGQDILITKDKITRKQFPCIIFSPLCWFGNSTTESPTQSNILEYKEDFSNMLIMTVALFIPGFVIFYVFYSGVKALFIIGIAALLGLLFIRLTNHRISIKNTFLLGIYTSTPMLLAAPFDIVVHSLYYIHVIVFVILFALGLYLVAEKRTRY